MALKLKKGATLVFRGNVGDVVTLDVRALAPSTAVARIVGIFYDETTDTESPFTFTIQKGEFSVGLMLEATETPTAIEILETDGATSQRLALHFWNPTSRLAEVTILGK